MGRPQRRCRPDLRRFAPRLAYLPGRGDRRETANAPRRRCRGTASCRPGQTDHGERGKRPACGGPLVAARLGPMPADGRGTWRSPRSSPRAGKPSTWRRRTAGPRHEKPFGRSGVNTLAPLDAKLAEGRVRAAGPGRSPGRRPRGGAGGRRARTRRPSPAGSARPGRPGRAASRSITLEPQPSACWRRRISLPISQ